MKPRNWETALATLVLTCTAFGMPKLIDWTNSKTADRDRMFLVKRRERITFSVTVEGAEGFDWQVNKRRWPGALKDRETSRFTWKVPDEGGIWEIHVRAYGNGGDVHHEWVVSTLSSAEAPTFFDYFSDKRCRERIEKDPWGRPLPEWVVHPLFGIPDMSKCWLEPTDKSLLDDERNTIVELYYPYKHAYGTWKFRYCVPEGPHCTHGGWTHFRFNFLHYPGCGHYARMFYVREAGQDHAYFGPGAHAWDHDMGVGYERNSNVWYEVTIVHTPDDEFYAFRDGILEMRGHDRRGSRCTGMSIRLHTYTPEHTPNSKIYVDCIEVYKDRFLFPTGHVSGAVSGGRPFPTAPRPRPARKREKTIPKIQPLTNRLITDWWNSKTGDSDRMFVAGSNEKITFRITTKGCDQFRWLVNKRPVAEGRTMFTWTVPEYKDIFEIHVIASGKGTEAHHEWVVSNMRVSEAPSFFDYFADGALKDRSETDPWGRKLPEWKTHSFSGEWPKPFPDMVVFGNDPPKNWFKRAVELPPDPSFCFLQPSSIKTSEHVISYLSAEAKSVFGTWKLRFRFPNGYSPLEGGWCHFNYRFAYCNGYLAFPMWITISSDNRHHLRPGSTRWGMDFCSYFKPEKRWYELTIIRDKDRYVYTFVDGLLQFCRRNPIGIQESGQIWLRLGRFNTIRYPGDTVLVDCLQIYPDKYMFPRKSVRFNEYIARWVWDGSRFKPVKRRGIVVKGRGVRLADIATLLRKPSLFGYDPNRKEAVCKADLVVEDGCELVIDGEVLRFDSKGARPLRFVVGYGATLKIMNGTVTTVSDKDYFIWQFCNSTRFGFPLSLLQKEQCLNPLNYSSLVRITIIGSTIANFAYLFIENPNEVRIKKSCFAGVREVDVGEYSAPKGIPLRRREHVRGRKGFWLALGDVDPHDFEVSNVKFSASEKLNLMFMLKEEQQKWNVYNIDAGRHVICVKKALGTLGAKLNEYPTYLGLVNSRFADLKVLSEDAVIVPKYYLDVKVVDERGRPVPGALVRVINEVEPIRFRPENRERYAVETGQEGERVFQTLLWQLPIDETTTGANGHTPLPSDAEHTIIVADFAQDAHSKKEFTYTVEAITPDGRRGNVKGVDPDTHWYRPNPDVPTYTVVVVTR